MRFHYALQVLIISFCKYNYFFILISMPILEREF